MDIKELKILDISNGCAVNSASVSSKPSSAPVAVPKGDPRAQGRLNSPQHCSKSYGERHLDVPGQPKAFRRRHNSCKCRCETRVVLDAVARLRRHVSNVEYNDVDVHILRVHFVITAHADVYSYTGSSSVFILVPGLCC